MSESKESVRVGRDTPTDAELLEAVPPRATGRRGGRNWKRLLNGRSQIVTVRGPATTLSYRSVVVRTATANLFMLVKNSA